MRCTENQVEFLGWEFLYVVDVTDRRRPWLARKISLPSPGVTVADFQGVNLAYWSRAGVTELASDDPESLFELVIAKVDKRLPRGLDHYTITELIQRSRTGPNIIRASVRLFFGVMNEAGD